MSKTSFYNFRLARLFPPNDEYAATMARICILWEDFITEATGGAAQSIKEMDGHSPQWRRLYFLRRSIGTIHEIRRALHHLRTQREFNQTLSKQPQADQDRFIESYKTLCKHEKLIKDLRDTIAGGHVLQKAVKEGLRRMDSEVYGMLQRGEYYKDIRFKFAHAIVLEVFFKDRSGKDAEEELNWLTTLMHEIISNALRMIEFAMSVYVRERGITPL